MGKEVLPSLCPPGFWLRFNFVHLVPRLVEIRFSFVNSWARDDGLLLDDFVTPWSYPYPSRLVLQPPESRVSTNRSFLRSRENPTFAQISFDSSQSVRTFVEIFWGCVLEVIIFISPKFELFWTWFDRPIVKFFKDRGLEKPCSARAGFFVIAGWTDDHILLRRINRWVKFSRVGVFGIFCGCTGASKSSCIGSTGVTTRFAFSLLRSAYRFS